MTSATTPTSPTPENRDITSLTQSIVGRRWFRCCPPARPCTRPPDGWFSTSSSSSFHSQLAIYRQPGNDAGQISWKWTADGEYSTSSAYQTQFVGVYSKMRLTPIWKARAEHKCRFFAWTLMHKKILTAINLFKRGWTDDTDLDCKLCGNEPKTPVHLCKDCPYTKEVWATLGRWFDLSALDSVSDSGSLHAYWWRCRRKFEKRQRREVDGIFIYWWWNI